MRLIHSIFLFYLFIVVSCKQVVENNTEEKYSSYNSMQDKYPFVEFDSMCLISIDSKDFADAIDSIYIENNHALINDYMQKPLAYNSQTCNQNDIKSIIDFFSKKSIWNSEIAVACEPIFRNAILCYNKSKLVSTTLICFDCQIFLFQPTKSNNDDDIFIENVKVTKDVFEKNGLKAKHVFDQPEVPPPPPKN